MSTDNKDARDAAKAVAATIDWNNDADEREFVERNVFEVWATKEGYIGTETGDNYRIAAADCWKAWQAAHAAQAERIAKMGFDLDAYERLCQSKDATIKEQTKRITELEAALFAADRHAAALVASAIRPIAAPVPAPATVDRDAVKRLTDFLNCATIHDLVARQHTGDGTLELRLSDIEAVLKGKAAPAMPAQPSADLTDDDIIAITHGPKALLKREDWDATTRKPKVRPGADLQAAIMALPCVLPAGYDDNRECLIYLQSHNTAVARAAALVASARPSAALTAPDYAPILNKFMMPADQGHLALCTEIHRLAAHCLPERAPEGWKPITKPGQVKPGDKLRFTIGSEKYSEKAKHILSPGTHTEEIIYNKRQNYYLITSMAIKNAGSQKNVEFFSAAPPTPGAK